MERHFGCFHGVILVQRHTLLINALAIRHRDCKLSNLDFFKEILHIDHGHGQQKTEHTIGPAHCHPCLLHAYWVHSCTIMIFNDIPILVVVLYHFWISKCLHMFDTIHQVVSFFLTEGSQSSIHCHEHHDTIWLLHWNNMEFDIVKHSLKCIRLTNPFFCKVRNDVIAGNVFNNDAS